MIRTLRQSAWIVIAGLVLARIDIVHGQTYPTRPVTLISPYPPGGPTSDTGRAARPKSAKPARPAGDRRECRRRRRQYRRIAGGARRAGRPYPADPQSGDRLQPRAVPEPDLQSRKGSRRHQPDQHDAAGDRRPQIASRQYACRTDRLDEGSAGDPFRAGRHRQHGASVRRAVRADDRRQGRLHPVSRRRAGAAGPHRRACRPLLFGRAGGSARHQGRHASRRSASVRRSATRCCPTCRPCRSRACPIWRSNTGTACGRRPPRRSR